MDKQLPLYEEIEQQIEQQITNKVYQVGDKLPTESDLMQQYAVSRMTIRKALEILVNKELITRYPGKGSFINDYQSTSNLLNNQNTKTIGVIFPKLSPAFGQEILSTLSTLSDQEDINLLYAESPNSSAESEKRAIQRMRQIADGIIIWPTPGKGISPSILKLIIDGYPVVLLDRYLKDLDTSYVVTDNEAAVIEALDYLINLGHTNICLVPKSNTSDTSIQDRLLFAQQYLENNSKIDTSLIHTKGIKFNLESDVLDNKSLIKQNIIMLLKQNPNITVFFVTEYYPATLLYNVLEELGYHVPEDFSIICFDSPTFYYEKVVHFTHIKQNEKQIGSDAFNILKKNLSNSTIVKKLEKSQLIIGETTAKPRTNTIG